MQPPTNKPHTVPLVRYNKIVPVPRLAAETRRKTGALNQLNGNRESESLIRNAPELLINLPSTSRHQGRTQGESFIRNASQKAPSIISKKIVAPSKTESESADQVEAWNSERRISETSSISINKERQHHLLHLYDSILQSPTNKPHPAPLARYNKIVPAPRLAADTRRKTGMPTQLNGNQESESLTRNISELLINLPTPSRHPGRTRGESFIRNASQKSPLLIRKKKATPSTTSTESTQQVKAWNSERRSETSSISINEERQHHSSHLDSILKSSNNEKQPATLIRYNTIVQSPRIVVETPRKTCVLTQLNRHHESESLIRNALELLINLPTTSHHPGRTRAESFIRNASQYKPGTNAELQKQKEKIERTEPVKINTQHHQHHSINKKPCFSFLRSLHLPLSAYLPPHSS